MTASARSWRNSNDSLYNIPITAATAEYAAYIPQGSELINQTSMCVDNKGNSYIATYWKALHDSIPQFYIVYNSGKGWHTQRITDRKTPFSLSGGGTKRIPVSRPLILIDTTQSLYVIYRDEERGNKVTVSICEDLHRSVWVQQDLTAFPVGMWEPTFDSELWRSSGKLNLFVQNVMQGDAEQLENITPQMISVLEFNL